MPPRPETSRDHAGIDRVLTAAFETYAEAGLVRALRQSDRLSISLVAEDRDEIVGHAAFSPVTLVSESGPGTGPDTRSGVGIGLAPVAVLPTHQRQGIGGALVRAGLSECERLGCSWCVVLGDPAYYPRFGFKAASGFGLGNEYGVDEPFMAIELVRGSLGQVRGIVQYAPEFRALG